MTAAEQLTDPVAVHAEGPVWFAGWGGLRWVDMLAGDVLHLREDASIERWSVGTIAAVIRPRTNGGIVVAVEREFVLADEVGGPLRHLGEVFTDTGIRFNEGGCDPSGNLLVGTMAYDETPGAGTVYRLSAAGDVDVVFGDVTISNGLAWTADGTTAYYNDTPTHRIDAFSWDAERGLHDRRPFVRVDPEDGSPDGLTVDVEGGVWTALYGGSAVHHYDSAGHLDEIVELPVPKVTACVLGGERLDRLFITTSADGDDLSVRTAAGAVFVADVGTPGLPVLPYAG